MKLPQGMAKEELDEHCRRRKKLSDLCGKPKQRRTLSSLFPEPMTGNEVRRYLKRAHYIAARVEQLAPNDMVAQRFFKAVCAFKGFLVL